MKTLPDDLQNVPLGLDFPVEISYLTTITVRDKKREYGKFVSII